MAKFITMEIGPQIVRVAEVTQSGQKVRIDKAYVFEMPEDAVKDGKVRVSDSVVGAFRQALAENKTNLKDVSFSVDSARILFSEVMIPEVPVRMIQSTLELSFGDYFPADQSLYHVSYYVKEKKHKLYKNLQSF